MESTTKTVEEHAQDAKTPAWLVASARAYHGWAVGQELSRSDYDAAIDEAANCKTGTLKDADGNDTSGLL